MNNKRLPKPEWLKISLGNNATFANTGKIIQGNKLHTICQSGRCPNLGECWNKGTATFMIAGDICTRSCKFCNTQTGCPLPLDLREPQRIAESVKAMGLKHVVLTSVDRDDLPDYGAAHWAETIRQVKSANPSVTMEVLVPDFRGNKKCLDMIIREQPEIISHNMETVRRLTPRVRSVAQYDMSLSVLAHIAASGIASKSGIMLGLGETTQEVVALFDDLLHSGCKLLSIGQYLQPSRKNIEVVEYISPSVFEEYRIIAENKGFKHVRSAPLVRSSYHSIDFCK
jgi:lipoic acid synthetase